MKRQKITLLNEPFDEFIMKDRAKSFALVFEEFRKKKNLMRDDELYNKALMRKDTYYRIHGGGTSNRDYLFSLALALELNLKETEILFNSCGLTLKGNRYGIYCDNNAEARERGIIFAINHKWDITKLNYALEKRNLKPLGNVYENKKIRKK